jgi:hypothetical protein
MRMIGAALTVGLLMALAAPAAAKGPVGLQNTQYEIDRAAGFVRVDFAGDTATDCAGHGICGVSGTVIYAFGGPPKGGFMHVIRTRGRLRFAQAFFQTEGITTSEVATAGSPERCVDRAENEFETLFFTRERAGMRFAWRGVDEFARDPLRTRCSGPSVSDLAASDALPDSVVSTRPFRATGAKLRMAGRHPFAANGFAGTVTWDLRIRIDQRPRRRSR